MNKWNVLEVNILKEKYSNSTFDEICELLKNRSESAIYKKAARMGLLKSKGITTSKNNLVGSRFGMLFVIARGEDTFNGKKTWICKCDCGNVCLKGKLGYDLKIGKIKSCGCFRKETTRKLGEKIKTHGMSGTRLINIWTGMKQRCYYKKNVQYKNYGGKGICICEEWKNDFTAFKDWALKNGYNEKLTIDRIDNNGWYQPDNCRWATYMQQENNRTNNRMVDIDGELDTLSNIARKNCLRPATLSWRINNEWQRVDLFIKPNLNNKKIRKEKVEVMI